MLTVAQSCATVIIMNMNALAEALVNERAQRLLDLDDAYPDVGMGMSYSTARADAIAQLKNEGVLPKEYKRLKTMS